MRVVYLVLLSMAFFTPLPSYSQTEPEPEPGPMPMAIDFTVQPDPGFIFIEETTNTLTVTVNNFTNFTNVVVTADAFGGVARISMVDSNSATFTFIPPLTDAKQPFTVTFVVEGDDLAFREAYPDLTNYISRATNSLNYVLVPRPPNDPLHRAFKLPPQGGVSVGTNEYGSMQLGEPLHERIESVDASIWWTWSSPVTTPVLVDTGGSAFDTVLGVYTGAVVSNLTRVASSTYDLDRNLNSHVSFVAQAGVTYRIAVAGATTNDFGFVRVRVAPGKEPDVYRPESVINQPDDNLLVTNGLLTVIGTTRDDQFHDSGVAYTLLRVNGKQERLADGADTWTGSVALTPGTNLVEAIGVDFAGNRGIPFGITVIYRDPVNDDFADSINFEQLSGFVVTVNGRATVEPGEPIHAANVGGRTIWYTWRAPVNGSLALSLDGSTFDTLLGLYTGSQLSELVEVASNDDTGTNRWSSLQHSVSSNQVYHIAIAGYGESSGTIHFTYNYEPDVSLTLHPLTVIKPFGGVVDVASGQFPENSDLVLNAIPFGDFGFSHWETTPGRPSANNPLLLRLTRAVEVRAVFRPVRFTDSFDSTGLSMFDLSNSGNAPWRVVNEEGNNVAQSGSIGHGQTSQLLIVTNTVAGKGWFRLKVSSEENWDVLEFLIDGRSVGRWSGLVNWTEFTFDVPKGRHTFMWRYKKDSTLTSSGMDAAFVDDIYIPIAIELPPTSGQLALSMENGVARIELSAEAERIYIVQTSTDLVNWQNLATRAATGGSIVVMDPRPADERSRFYRAQLAE